jgi:hypothetical protein
VGSRFSQHSGAAGADQRMHVILSDFLSLDGVVQAPGGPEEDTATMGLAIDEALESTDALLFGRCPGRPHLVGLRPPARAGLDHHGQHRRTDLHLPASAALSRGARCSWLRPRARARDAKVPP